MLKIYVIQLGIERNAYLRHHTTIGLEIRHETLDQIGEYLGVIRRVADPDEPDDINPTLEEALKEIEDQERTVYRGSCGACNVRVEVECWTIFTHTLDGFNPLTLEIEGIHTPEITGLADSQDGCCD